MNGSQTQTWLPVVITLPILLLVLLRNRRPRTLRIERLWIIPLLVTVGVGMGVYFGRPDVGFGPVDLALSAAGVALGAAAGWWRGKSMRISADQATRTLTVQASPFGLIFIFLLLIVRRFLDYEAHTGAVPLPFKPAALIDPLLFFAVAMVVAQRMEMWIRARRLLAGTPR